MTSAGLCLHTGVVSVWMCIWPAMCRRLWSACTCWASARHWSIAWCHGTCLFAVFVCYSLANRASLRRQPAATGRRFSSRWAAPAARSTSLRPAAQRDASHPRRAGPLPVSSAGHIVGPRSSCLCPRCPCVRCRSGTRSERLDAYCFATCVA